jgi:hypothetical protein
MGKALKDRLLRAFVLGLCLAILPTCVNLAQVAEESTPAWQAAPLPRWEEAFREADLRWRGADGVTSVPLSASKTLWLFGDTWITDAGARGRQGAVLIRNSLAVEDLGDCAPGKIKFFWQESSGRPADAFPSQTETEWLWPMSGARVGKVLFLFLYQCAESKSPLGFELSGSVLLKVSNPDEAPEHWKSEQQRIPFFRHTDKGDLFFGVACLVSGDFLYIYGAREDWSRGAEGRSLLVARVPVDGLEREDFSAWQFFSGDGWAADLSRAGALFDGAATEMSVSYLPGIERFIAVYTYCGLSEQILARVASRPQGPWETARLLYSCPDVSWSRNYFCYAGKAHPELACTGKELVLTYATNSLTLEDHYQDMRLYWPRFVRLALQ